MQILKSICKNASARFPTPFFKIIFSFGRTMIFQSFTYIKILRISTNTQLLHYPVPKFPVSDGDIQ